jgi:hypothetical protein
MNQRDRDNLNFLLQATSESLSAWYAQASEDDLEYADELLNFYAQELDEAFVELVTSESNVFVSASTSVH